MLFCDKFFYKARGEIPFVYNDVDSTSCTWAQYLCLTVSFQIIPCYRSNVVGPDICELLFTRTGIHIFEAIVSTYSLRTG